MKKISNMIKADRLYSQAAKCFAESFELSYQAICRIAEMRENPAWDIDKDQTLKELDDKAAKMYNIASRYFKRAEALENK